MGATITQTARTGADANFSTFSAAAIGAATSDRIVLVAVLFRIAGSQTITGVTVGGNAMTQLVTVDGDAGANTTRGALWVRAVSNVENSGTTADIIVTLSGGSAASYEIVVFNMVGANGITPYDTDTGTTSNSINVLADGAALALAGDYQGYTAFTWTGLTERTENYTGVNLMLSGTASADFSSAQTPLSISVTPTGSPTTPVMISASFSRAAITPTLTAAVGSYVLSGIAAALNKGKTIVAAAGSYVLTGVAAVLSSTRTIMAAAGSYALTGVAAVLKRATTITAAAGSYILTGLATLFPVARIIAASAGAYVVTGVSIVFHWSAHLVANAGAYILTGISALVVKSKNLIVEAGSYTLTGLSIGLGRVIATARKFAIRTSNPQLRVTRITDAILRKRRS